MRFRWWLVLLLVVVAVVALVVWAVTRPTPVTVATVERGDLVAELAATGVVDGYQAQVAPEVSGRVVAVLVEEGESVRVGQVLARLDSTQPRAALGQARAALAAAQADRQRATSALATERRASAARIATAQAQLATARARLRDLQAGARPQEITQARQAVAAAQAEADLAAQDQRRAESLYEQGAISRQQLDQARARLASAQATLRQAEANLSQVQAGARAGEIEAAAAVVRTAEAELAAARAAAGQVQVLEQTLAAAQAAVSQAAAALQAAADTLAKTVITSPVNGRVARRFADVGDLATPGNPLFAITDPRHQWVTAEVDEEDVAFVYQGQHVQISAEALPAPIGGTVREVGPAAVPRDITQVRARIVRTRVELDHPSDLLRPGMEVDVNGSRVLARDVLLAPLDALVQQGNRYSVWVVQRGRAYRRPVTVGHRSYEQAEVLTGLAAGDRVVVSGSEGLRPGRRVAATEGER